MPYQHVYMYGLQNHLGVASLWDPIKAPKGYQLTLSFIDTVIQP